MIYIGLNWQHWCINYVTVRCPKSLTISSKIFLVFTPGLWPACGTRRVEEFSEGAQIFWTMSNSFKLCPTHFSKGGAKNVLRGLRPFWPPWLRTWFIHTKPDSLTTKIILYKESLQILEKKVFLVEGLRSGKKSNSLEILPNATFCKHYKDRLLNYE